jgi:hypothetical protein
VAFNMSAGGYSPEELEALIEDAFVLRDGMAFASLFEDGGVLLTGGACELRGREAIAQSVGSVWLSLDVYFTSSHRCLSNRDSALLTGDGVIAVARRCADRYWRLALVATEPHKRGDGTA